MQWQVSESVAIDLSRPVMMGIMNVTPDSFSDGGQFASPDAARSRGLALVREGAGILDIGGESTRPGAERVAPEEQIRRVQPVVAALRTALNAEGLGAIQISVDTTRAQVARAAIEAGASIINDVSAGLEDPGIFEVAGQFGAGLVLMHMQGEPGTMQDQPVYEDVLAEVEAFLLERVATAKLAGVPASRLAIDPGIGFGKTLDHNLALLAGLPRLCRHGLPVLLGTSRKRMFAQLSPDAQDPSDRLPGTLATTALGVAAGVRLFRVHDVKANRQAAETAFAVSG